MPMPFTLDHLHINPDRNEILNRGETIKLDHKVMQLLQYFAENAGRDLSKEEIIRAVWGEGVFSEEVLTVAVSSLRKALCDDSRTPRYIKTLPRFGYRMLIAPGSVTQNIATPSSKPSVLEFLEERVGLRFLIIAGLIALFLLVLLTRRHFH